MPKPPSTPPHSDLDGVHQDGVRSIDAANAAGEDAGSLGLARREGAGRPRRSRKRSLDDRSG